MEPAHQQREDLLARFRCNEPNGASMEPAIDDGMSHHAKLLMDLGLQSAMEPAKESGTTLTSRSSCCVAVAMEPAANRRDDCRSTAGRRMLTHHSTCT